MRLVSLEGREFDRPLAGIGVVWLNSSNNVRVAVCAEKEGVLYSVVGDDALPYGRRSRGDFV